MNKILFIFIGLSLSSYLYAIEAPSVHPNLVKEGDTVFFVEGYRKLPLEQSSPQWTLQQLMGRPIGTDKGILFDFGSVNGKLYYGFLNPRDGLYPQPIFYKDFLPIVGGQTHVQICCGVLTDKYDIIQWEKHGKGTFAYRVVNEQGRILYDGKLAFFGKGPFQVNQASIVEGPFVNFSQEGSFDQSIRLSFETLTATTAQVTLHPNTDNIYRVYHASTHHEIILSHLQPNTVYSYSIETKNKEHLYNEDYSFQTAPLHGSRQAFVFAYASDSRQGSGGGERELGGVNAYIVKKIMALARFKGAKFVQFTGDMISGYQNHPEHLQVEYRNWKRVVEPFAHYLPTITALGNHEALLHFFGSGKNKISVDRFPYETDSTEAVFATQFVHPSNGPNSEDDAPYDPHSDQQDFPSYQENVFYYIYDNMAMVVLNSNYWYAPSLTSTSIGGNLHGYLMDKQLEWLETTLATLEANQNIDWIWVTQHTPAFPNGGHIGDDMWYGGNNQLRAVVKSTPDGENLVTQGILEQRDKYLKILMKNKKVVALLSGDEHHFSVLEINKNVNIYPKDWDKEDIRNTPEFRPLLQVINGAAGAPAYAQEQVPWSKHVQAFSSQYAVVLFYVHGKSLQMEVLNPDTLDIIWPLKSLQ